MPDSNQPKLAPWVATICENVTANPSETVLVGHSLGGATMLRYLEQAEVTGAFAGVILIASTPTILVIMI